LATLIGGLSIAAVAHAAPTDESPDADDEQAALRKFDRAQKAYDAGRYEAALELFREVADVLHSPNSAFMAARCLRELDRLPEAYEMMSLAVSLANQRAVDDPSYLQTRDVAAAEREQIGAKIGLVVLAVVDPPDGLEVKLEGRLVDATQWGAQLGVAPGSLTIEAEAPGYEPFERSLEIGAGATETVAVVLEPVGGDLAPSTSEDHGGGALFTAGLITLGVGVVGLGTFITAGVLAEDRFAELEEGCGSPPCTDPKYVDVVDEGKTLDLVANIGLGVGIAGLAAGTLMVLLDLPAGGDEEAAKGEPTGELSWSAGPEGAGVRYAWRF
jgi:hypothetical protein